MNKEQLNEYLSKKCNVPIKLIKNSSVTIAALSLFKLRDIILSQLGTIQYEDVDNQIYIAAIRGGFLKKNTATVAFHLFENQLLLAVYAREGIINQHTSEDVFNEIQKVLQKNITQ